MRRRLLNLLTGVSLLLCVGVCVLWVRSQTTVTVFSRASREGRRATRETFHSFAGRLTFRRLTYDYDPGVIRSHEVQSSPWEREELEYPWRIAVRLHDRTSPSLYMTDLAAGQDFESDGGFEVAVPYLLPALVSVALPALWGVRWCRRGWLKRRTPGGICRSCGYDLRATPDRCPECGTAPAAR